MPKEFLDTPQLQRSDQLYFTHKALSTLIDAAKEAVKAHDKYVEALDKVMSAILDNSDCMEETRRLFGTRGESNIAPTFEVTGRLSNAFAAWKLSAELKKLREDLDLLIDLGGTAKRSVKLAEKSSSDLEKAAQKAAKVNTEKMQRKIGDTHTSKQKRLKEQQDEMNAQVVVMDNAVVESMMALGQWWSGKLVHISNDLYDDYSNFSETAATCFPRRAHSMRSSDFAASSPPPQQHQPQHQHQQQQHRNSTGSNHTPLRGAVASHHTDPTAASSPSAPSSSVNSRQQHPVGAGAEAGSPLAPTALPRPIGSPNADALVPPPLFGQAAAAAATSSPASSPSPPAPSVPQHGAAAGSGSRPSAQPSDGNGAASTGSSSQPLMGAPLLFHPRDVPRNGCSAE